MKERMSEDDRGGEGRDEGGGFGLGQISIMSHDTLRTFATRTDRSQQASRSTAHSHFLFPAAAATGATPPFAAAVLRM